MANRTSENSAPFLFLPRVTSEPSSFAELYICASNYFFSSPYNKRLHAFLLPGLGQQEECPPKYSLSCLWHAHLSARQHSNFLDVFGFNERDLGATNAVGAVMTHFNSTVQIESLRLSFNLYYSLFHGSNYSEYVRQLLFKTRRTTQTLL